MGAESYARGDGRQPIRYGCRRKCVSVPFLLAALPSSPLFTALVLSLTDRLRSQILGTLPSPPRFEPSSLQEHHLPRVVRRSHPAMGSLRKLANSSLQFLV